MSTTYDPQRDLLPPGRRPSVHDGLAITAFALAWLVPLVGFILGWVSVASAHRAGRRASGLAVAALVVGGIATVIITVVVIVAVAAASDAATQANLQNQQEQLYLQCLQSQVSSGLQLTCPSP